MVQKHLFDKNHKIKIRTLVVTASFSTETHLILKKLKNIVKRDFFVITWSCEQYKDEINNEEDIKEKKTHEIRILVSDNLSDYEQKAKDLFITRVRRKNLTSEYSIVFWFAYESNWKQKKHSGSFK